MKKVLKRLSAISLVLIMAVALVFPAYAYVTRSVSVHREDSGSSARVRVNYHSWDDRGFACSILPYGAVSTDNGTKLVAATSYLYGSGNIYSGYQSFTSGSSVVVSGGYSY